MLGEGLLTLDVPTLRCFRSATGAARMDGTNGSSRASYGSLRARRCVYALDIAPNGLIPPPDSSIGHGSSQRDWTALPIPRGSIGRHHAGLRGEARRSYLADAPVNSSNQLKTTRSCLPVVGSALIMMKVPSRLTDQLRSCEKSKAPLNSTFGAAKARDVERGSCATAMMREPER